MSAPNGKQTISELDAWSLALAPTTTPRTSTAATDENSASISLLSNVHRGGHCSQSEAREWEEALQIKDNRAPVHSLKVEKPSDLLEINQDLGVSGDLRGPITSSSSL